MKSSAAVFVLGLFFALVPTSAFSAPSTSTSCAEIADNYSSSFSYAKAYLQSQKDTSKIDTLIAATKRCQIDSAEYGISRSELEEVRKKFWMWSSKSSKKRLSTRRAIEGLMLSFLIMRPIWKKRDSTVMVG